VTISIGEIFSATTDPETSMGSGEVIVFPFERDQYYSVQRLQEFEAELLRMRLSDQVLGNRLRTPTDPAWRWIKLRNEELIPMLYCVRHHKFSRDAFFRIMPEGDPVDLQVRDGDLEMKLQVTVAYPVWGSSKKGSQHHLKVEALNTGEIVSGYGPYKRTGGIVTGADRMKSSEEVDRVYGDGLKQALERKSKKDGSDQILVIYCQFYTGGIDAARFRKLAERAIASCNMTNFAHVWLVDYGEGFFVEF
jgi:hypothetical protein